jgi:hypothetical protein
MADQKTDVPPDTVVLSDRQQRWNASEREFHKTFYEYLRYFSTLGTGTIVAVGALLGKLFEKPAWQGMAVASIIALLLSVATSTVVYTVMIIHFPGRGIEADNSDKQIHAIALVITWLTFLVGIICLAVFVAKNLGK